MQALAQEEGDTLKIRHTQQLLERDLTPLATEVNRALQDMNREELFGSSADMNAYSPPSNDMESLISSSDQLLRESQSVLADTEHIGTRTLLQMGQQREQLENAHSSLQQVQIIAEQAKNILLSMSRKVCRSRLALYAMIAGLSTANVYVLYLIYRKHHPASSSATDSSDEDY